MPVAPVTIGGDPIGRAADLNATLAPVASSPRPIHENRTPRDLRAPEASNLIIGKKALTPVRY
jgi:hypothetical protein